MDAHPLVRRTFVVADSLHGLIQLSRFEKEVLSSPIFNRLHNVLQNSTVYLTYPACRTSRFAHSLGVLHLAGEFYYRRFLNATPEVKRRFLTDLHQELQRILDSDEYRSELDARFSQDFRLPEPFPQPCMEVLYCEHLPADGVDPSSRPIFLAGFQAVRLTGLLHDVGHPPLSHVPEAALGDLRAELESKPPDARTAREQEFLEIVNRIAPGEVDFHEALGRELAAELLRGALKRLQDRGEMVEENLAFLVLCTHLTRRILEDASPFSMGLHTIVASEFDADRLDFVPRDSVASGLTGEPFRYDRLRKGLQLLYASPPPTRDGPEMPLVVPSVRALSDVERFFKLYQDFYKYVVHHHRVVRTDGLLKESILHLAREYLASEEETPPPDDVPLIPHDISGLWIALDIKRHRTHRQSVEQYLQWDDNWLITILRQAYFREVARRHEKRTEPSRLELMLDEVLSSRRTYFSLYKGLEAFAELDEKFLMSLPQGIDFSKLLSADDLENPGVKELLDRVREHLDARQEDRPSPRKHGFFLSAVYSLWRCTGRVIGPSDDDFVFDAARQLTTEHDVTDVFVMVKELRKGVDVGFLLHSRDQVVHLDAISRLPRDLHRNVQLFPPFFTYLGSRKHLTQNRLSELRHRFAQHLAESIAKTLNNVTGKEVL